MRNREAGEMKNLEAGEMKNREAGEKSRVDESIRGAEVKVHRAGVRTQRTKVIRNIRSLRHTRNIPKSDRGPDQEVSGADPVLH